MSRVLAVAMAFTPAAAATAAEPAWSQFRGPAASGVADPQSPPVKVGPDQAVKWKVACPPGFSSPIVVGDLLVLTAFDAGKLFTVAYDRATGAEKWRANAPAAMIEAYHRTEGSPAASTPASDGTRVVSYFGSCGLFCHDLTGKELWRHELPCARTGSDFGTGTSPVVADGLVLLARDLLNDARLLAVRLADGKLAWEAKRDGKGTSWSTPAVWTTPAGKQIVLPGYGRMAGHDLATGKEVWAVAGMPSAPCTTPVVADGKLVYAGWSPGEDFKLPPFDEFLKADANKDGKIDLAESENTFVKGFFTNQDTDKDGFITRDEWTAIGKFMSAARNSSFVLNPGGAGDLTGTSQVVWKQTKGGLPYVPSPLAYRGQVYTANMRGQVTARELATGKDSYLDENVGLTGVYASPVGADGHVYWFGLDGTVVVVKAGGDLPEVAHRAKFGERVAATPAIADNTLYVRTATKLYAFAK